MSDITKTFRALVKAKKVSTDVNPNAKTTIKKPEHVSTRFLSQAKVILNELTKLKIFLLESRTDYLSPPYLISSVNRIMDDEKRIHYEHDVEKRLKAARGELEKLRSSIGHISFSGQRRSHYEFVTAHLERDLVLCTKIYGEQKCLRYKRESERKKIGRLDHENRQILATLDLNQLRPKPVKSISTDSLKDPVSQENKPVTSKDTFIAPAHLNHPASASTANNMDDKNSQKKPHDYQDDNEDERRIPSPEPTSQELQQLQMENKQLYRDVAQRSKEICEITDQVVNIAQLQKELLENILDQKDSIEQVDNNAGLSNDELAAAINQIRNAIKNAAQMRRWVIFFLLVMIFSLLFLDWYNV